MSSTHGVIDQRVGLVGATGLVVGNVIGIAIFVLAAPLATKAGPSVVLAMVAVLLVGMLVFIVPGVRYVDVGNFTPTFPNGVGPFVVAVVSLHFPLRGFSMLIEIGEEIENPARNIPRVLVLSAVIGLSLMIALLAVFVGVAGWRGVNELDAAVAGTFLPRPLVFLVVVAALLGSLTSVNTTFASYSRAIMRAARDDVVPEARPAIPRPWRRFTRADAETPRTRVVLAQSFSP